MELSVDKISDSPIEQAVERAIVTMNQNLGERLTVDDLARAAMFSKFHFTRIFQRTTGVSPGRFLSALRLQQAKRLLVSTSLSVADISMSVGYNSVGTFSSRFSRSVGMPPTVYRQRAGFAEQIRTGPALAAGQSSTAQVHGWVWPPHSDRDGLTFVGLFPDRIPEGQPIRCAVLTRPGRYQFDAIPPGTWYVLAQSIADDDANANLDPLNPRVCVATFGPLVVGRDTTIRADLALKPVRFLDPPVLLALLDARKLAMARVKSEMARLPVMAAGQTAA
ncbi:AraC family transcriptional regulator [Dactylosporangium sp. NPDC051484]|uniref:AraC family transcriptional regulator n=1 Tax=Dactylosporangium sp. NPDC051484 TaxID=3154942 RepID=UPI00344C487A